MVVVFVVRGLGRRFFIGSSDFFKPDHFPREIDDFPSRSRLEELVQTYKKTLETDPENPRVLTALGMVYFGLGRDYAIEAVNVLEEAREAGSLDKRVFYYLGCLYRDLGLNPFAVKELEKFLKNVAHDREVELELAKTYWDLGDYAKSLKVYEKLLETSSVKKDPLVAQNLALVAIKLKDWDRAKALLEELHRRDKDSSPELTLYLAEILYKLDKCEEALPLYEEVALSPIDPEKEKTFLEGRLSCLLKASEPDSQKIIEVAQALLKADKKSKPAQSALKKYKAHGKRKP